MVNHGNFLHSFVITVPSSITKELEKKPASLHHWQSWQGRSFSLGDSLGPIKNDNKKEGRRHLLRGANSSGRWIFQEEVYRGNSQPDKVGERISKKNLRSCTRCKVMSATRPFLQSHLSHKTLSFVSLYHSNSATSSELLRANPLKIHSVIQGFITMETAYNQYFL